MSRLCEGTDNYKNRVNLMKEKFLIYYSSLNQPTSLQLASQNDMPHSTTNGKKDSPYFVEMKKMDLFDLGVMLIIAATGGLDVISEEAISNGLPNL